VQLGGTMAAVGDYCAVHNQVMMRDLNGPHAAKLAHLSCRQSLRDFTHRTPRLIFLNRVFCSTKQSRQAAQSRRYPSGPMERPDSVRAPAG
jgi:hypothetical protein